VKFFSLLTLLLAMVSLGIAEPIASNPAAPNWGGQYAPCLRHADLLDSGHVNLGVRISTTNNVLAHQFERAMQFWSEVLDLDWHQVNSTDCALQLVDGTPSIFNWCACISARSQLPDRPAFEGWIAFNPRQKLSKQEMFLDSVHEIGHILGLAHNPSDSSVMYFFGVDKTASLDTADLNALASKHTLRPGIFANSAVKNIPVIAPARSARWHKPFNLAHQKRPTSATESVSPDALARPRH
jgi:hypothetical protein